MSPTLFVFSIASDVSKAHRLLSTAHKLVHVEVYEKITWSGYVDKISCMIELLSSANIADDDCIVFVDAYDVLCYADQEEILCKFSSFDCDLLISAELTCYPAENQPVYNYMLQESCPQITTNYQYVNSGGYMGTKKALLTMLTWKPLDQIQEICVVGGDQNYVTQYYLEHVLTEPRIQLDTKQLVFQNLHKVELTECSYSHGRFHNDVLDTWPCFVHFNGYNYYDFQLMNQETGQLENILDACIDMSNKSLVSPAQQHTIHYSVPYFIVYQGVEQCNMKQTNCTYDPTNRENECKPPNIM